MTKVPRPESDCRMLNSTNGGGTHARPQLWSLALMVIAIAVVSACTTPSMVYPQPEKGFVSISAGVSSTCGVHADGWASCWPHNGWGKIDIAALDGSTDDARVASGLPGGAAGESDRSVWATTTGAD